MSLIERNTGELFNPETYKMKALLIALAGTGKTSFIGTVPGIGVAACETGHGSGLLTIASRNVPYVEPSNYKEVETFCSGDVFKPLPALGVDSLSAITKGPIKDYALSFQRKFGDTPKRLSGVPEQDDYGVMGELTRRCLAKLLSLPKHIIVTCTLKLPSEPEMDNKGNIVRPAMPGMPDLPGQMALGSAAMFDIVLVMRTRPALRDPKDPKSRYSQRYFMTTQSDKWVAKSRLTKDGPDLLDPEEVFDLTTGQGTFPFLLNKILTRFAEVKK